MSVRMKEIADRCKVSIKTVSNVINRLPNVGEPTRRKVLEAIRELNYVPNQQARSLVMKLPGAKSQLGYRIGCVFPAGLHKYENSYFTRIFKGIEEELTARGQQLSFLASISELEDNPLKMNWLLSPEQTDALISFVGPDSGSFRRIASLPLVLIGKQDGYESICVDKFGGIAGLVDLLHSLGHRRIGYVGKLDDDRFRAFRLELEQRGIPLRPEYFLETPFGFAGGQEAANRFLVLPDRPTAVCCASDYTAIGFLHPILEAGLRVPQDLSVTGYDNLPEASLIYPPLTTVDVHMEGIGRLAVRMLLEQIRHPSDEHSCHTLSSRLVLRKSTGRAVS